jgi:hypothetical protein
MYACVCLAGIRVKLYCTQLEAVVKPEAVQQQMETQNEPALAAKGKGKGRPSSNDKSKERPRSAKKQGKEALDVSAGVCQTE